MKFTFTNFLGELERIFLVLREKVALRRLKARDGQTESGDPVPESAPADPEPDKNRGQKRNHEPEGPPSPSKRPALQ